MQPKKFSEYTPITETDGSEVIPILKEGANATVKSEDLPISTATQTAIDAADADIAAHVADIANPHQVTKSQVGLGNADNTSDANKPISSAVQSALGLKAPLESPTFTGAVTVPTPSNATDATTKEYVDSHSATVSDATSSSKGIVKLAGDISGTADAPTVPGLTSKVAKGELVFNIKDYGAVADGNVSAGTGTDNTTFIQNAMNAAGSSGGILFIPSGVYRINSSILPKSNVKVIGAGASSILVSPTANLTALIMHSQSAASGITLVDFSVDSVAFYGPVTSTSSVPARARTRGNGAQVGIWITGSLDASTAPTTGPFGATLVQPPTANPTGLVQNISITNCVFRNMNWLPSRLFGVTGKVLWSNNEAYNCMDVGFGYNEEVIITNNHIIMASDNGISISRGNNKIVCAGNAIENCAYTGIFISGFNGYAGPTDFTCTGNTIKNVTGGILMQDQVTTGIISSNTIDRGWGRMGSDTYVSCIQINGNAGDYPGGIDTGLNIVGNILKGGAQSAIYIDNAAGLNISSNMIIDTGTQYLADGTTSIASNNTTQNIGIYFPNPSQVSNIAIKNNMIYDSRTPIYTNYAIYPQSGMSGVLISGNTISSVNNDVNKMVYIDNVTSGNYPTETIVGPDANVGKIVVLKGNARSILQTTNDGSVTSILHLMNTAATSGSGVGFIFSSGPSISAGFIGGLIAARTDTSSNSNLYLRLMSNGSLTASDVTSPFYIEGTNDGVRVNLHSGISYKQSTKTNNYTINRSDSIILCDTQPRVFAVTLPDAATCTGQKFVIKDSTGYANTNNLTVNTTSSQTIDGATTYVLKRPYAWISVVSNGTSWSVVECLQTSIQMNGATIFGTLSTDTYFAMGGFTLNSTLTMNNGAHIALGTSTGTRIGTGINQKLGFYNATPIVQPASTPAAATDLATALTLVNDLRTKLLALGLVG